MIRIELNYVVAAANCLIQIAGDGTSVNVIRENCLPGCRFCFCSHSRGSRQKLNRPPILHSEGPMAGFKNLFASLSSSSRDSSSPDRPSQRRADSNSSDKRSFDDSYFLRLPARRHRQIRLAKADGQAPSPRVVPAHPPTTPSRAFLNTFKKLLDRPKGKAYCAEN